jgi:hypothetical protein
MQKRFILLFIVMTMCAISTSAFAAPPEYTAMKAGSKMLMDGVLDEPAWQQAQPVGPFKFQWYKDGEQEQTEAKIVWDDTRIYFAFKADDKHIWADHYSPNDPVSADDCCEAFIAPVGEGPEQLDYINYEINCIGTWKVGYHADSRKKVLGSWQEPWGIEIGRYIRGTVNRDDDIDHGWVLEYSIPWSHFSEFGAKFPPKNGQVIHVGLHRTGGKTNLQYSQWAPSQTDKPQFHSPKDFGKVILSTKVLK